MAFTVLFVLTGVLFVLTLIWVTIEHQKKVTRVFKPLYQYQEEPEPEPYPLAVLALLWSVIAANAALVWMALTHGTMFTIGHFLILNYTYIRTFLYHPPQMKDTVWYPFLILFTNVVGTAFVGLESFLLTSLGGV